MTLKWNNGMLRLGWLFSQDGYGVELAWGRCDALGISKPYGPFYADCKTWVLFSQLDYLLTDSKWRAIGRRLCR